MEVAEKVERINTQLKREAAIERMKISITAAEMKDYTLNEGDPLIDGIPKRDNPFAKRSRGCAIL